MTLNSWDAKIHKFKSFWPYMIDHMDVTNCDDAAIIYLMNEKS